MNDSTLITIWEIICSTICLVSICITVCSLRDKKYKEQWNNEVTERYKIGMANGYEQRFDMIEKKNGRKVQSKEYAWIKSSPKSDL